jgi:hypothetical protein
MTASKTPNLGLMSPVLSDSFTPDDFAQTFGILDAHPGIEVIANEASRPSGLGAAQHGRMYWQADQNIVWVWSQPSAMVAGSWLRMGNRGWLGGAYNGAQVNTTAISVATAPTIVNVSTLLSAGRPAVVLYKWTFIGNSYARFATIDLMANSSVVQETRFNGNGFDVAYSGATPYPPQSAMFAHVHTLLGAQQNVNFQVKLRCQDPAVVGSQQGGGSCFIVGASMDVFEL